MQGAKRATQSLLRNLGIYHRIKGSSLYDCYWWFADRKIIRQRQHEIEFYRHLLTGYRPGNLIFDIGANHGSKTDIFLRLGARVIAVEPDQLNESILKQRFLEYRLIRKPVVIVSKAVSNKPGAATIWIDAPGSAKNSMSRKWVEALKNNNDRFGQSFDFSRKQEVQTTTLEDLIGLHGCPFFIKIDVEGLELEVLSGLRQAVPFVSFEVNLPEFRDEGVECVRVLERLAHAGRFNMASDCRNGLTLGQWLDHSQFEKVLGDCTEKSVEVFWAAPRSGNDSRGGD